MAKADSVHQLKVTLRDIRPPVWRRIIVPSDLTLRELSPVLEAAMGWYGYHLHLFEIGQNRYGRPDPEWGTVDLDEADFSLGQVLPAEGAKLRWDYDFGDGWEHDVLVESISAADNDVEYPICIKGRRACPPEDCGGVWGYDNLLAALADKSHPDHKDLKEWLPLDFDPAHFDPDEQTAAMREAEPVDPW